MRRLHHAEAEAALLGAVILRGDAAFDQAAVEPADLFDLRNRLVWEAMGELRNAGHPCGDVNLIADVLGERIEQVGGLVYLAKTTEATSPDHVVEYSSLIRRSALTRRVQEALADLAHSHLEGTELLAQVLERAQGLARHIEDPTQSMPSVVKQAMDELAAALDRAEKGEAVWGLPTGYHELDKTLGGLQIGKLAILAARPSMGKSSLARSIASHVVGTGDGAHVFSIEDTATTYALRQIADEARVPLDAFRTLKLKAKQLAPIDYVQRRLREKKRWLLDETAALSTAEIGLRVRKHLVESATRLVVVDYAQLLTEPDVPAADLRVQMTMISKRLAAVARSMNVAVLLLSQLSRACEQRSDDKRPRLSDLRESGSLEQDAEQVLFLYRDEVYNPNTEDAGICEVLIRKNKNGPTGTVRLAWDAQHATLRSLSTREPEPAQQRFS